MVGLKRQTLFIDSCKLKPYLLNPIFSCNSMLQELKKTCKANRVFVLIFLLF